MPAKERLFANPERPNARAAGGAAQLGQSPAMTPSDTAPIGFDKKDFVTKKMHQGARVIGGTTLGRIGKGKAHKASHMLFEIRPAGRGAPRVDPKPILDGWKLLESTAIYRAAKKNPFVGDDAKTPTIGQILLMSKETLIQRVVNNPRINIYDCGASDVRSGQIDRRVLATLEYLASSGLKPTVSSLRCGHGYLTASGNVSEHSTGTAVDIAAVNGVPIVGHQGSGSITDVTIQRLLTLQGTMKPHQIISLMTYENADNTYAMGDHDDHIHVGWRPLYGQSKKAARRIDAILKPKQWIKLIDRLGDIDNPEVREAPSRFSLKVTKPASAARTTASSRHALRGRQRAVRAPFLDHITCDGARPRRLAGVLRGRAGAVRRTGRRLRRDRDRHRAGGQRGSRAPRGRAAARRSTSRSWPSTPRRSTPSTRPRSRPAGPTTARRAARPQYHERYYGAYVLDPDGNNVEAVCHTGPTEAEADSGRGRGAAA